MANILVTGINGFVGQHVARTLESKQHNVIGVGNQEAPSDEINLIISKYYSCDLTDPDQVKKIDLKDIDTIINLAGLAKVGDSRGQGELYNRVNVGVHTVLYDECLQQGANPRIIAVSTGAVYDADQPLPITETSELVSANSTNEYVQSKLAMETALEDYRKRGLHIIVARRLITLAKTARRLLIARSWEQIETAKSQGTSLKLVI